MGFLDKLLMNGVFNPNPDDPLFGGLIPRRVERPRMIRPEMEEAIPAGMLERQPLDVGGRGMLSRQGKPPIDGKAPIEGRTPTVRFQDMDIDRARLGLDRRRLEHTMNVDMEQLNDADMKMLLDQQKFASDEKMDKSKLDIDLRKQALDEWQAKNPQGEIKVDEQGDIVVINKLTGKPTKTGLKSGDLTEAEKIRRNFVNQQEMEKTRHKNDLALEDVKQKGRNKEISPAEQRVAETDAANELLNTKYGKLRRHIGFDQSGKLVIKKTGKKEIDDAIGMFEADMKTAANERMNKTRVANTPNVSSTDDTVDMIAPDGGPLKVPKAEVESMKRAGARIPGESTTTEKKPIEVDDGIELIYNAAGKVVGARNKKSK